MQKSHVHRLRQYRLYLILELLALELALRTVYFFYNRLGDILRLLGQTYHRHTRIVYQIGKIAEIYECGRGR